MSKSEKISKSEVTKAAKEALDIVIKARKEEREQTLRDKVRLNRGHESAWEEARRATKFADKARRKVALMVEDADADHALTFQEELLIEGHLNKVASDHAFKWATRVAQEEAAAISDARGKELFKGKRGKDKRAFVDAVFSHLDDSDYEGGEDVLEDEAIELVLMSYSKDWDNKRASIAAGNIQEIDRRRRAAREYKEQVKAEERRLSKLEFCHIVAGYLNPYIASYEVRRAVYGVARREYQAGGNDPQKAADIAKAELSLVFMNPREFYRLEGGPSDYSEVNVEARAEKLVHEATRGTMTLDDFRTYVNSGQYKREIEETLEALGLGDHEFVMTKASMGHGHSEAAVLVFVESLTKGAREYGEAIAATIYSPEEIKGMINGKVEVSVDENKADTDHEHFIKSNPNLADVQLTSEGGDPQWLMSMPIDIETDLKALVRALNREGAYISHWIDGSLVVCVPGTEVDNVLLDAGHHPFDYDDINEVMRGDALWVEGRSSGNGPSVSIKKK
jgi:hypothetical protein